MLVGADNTIDTVADPEFIASFVTFPTNSDQMDTLITSCERTQKRGVVGAHPPPPLPVPSRVSHWLYAHASLA